MVCSINSNDISTMGWRYSRSSGLLDFPGSKDSGVATDDTTSTNEIVLSRNRTTTDATIVLYGSFGRLVDFENATLWLTGIQIQTGENTIMIGAEEVKGTFEGLTVIPYFTGKRNLEVGSSYGEQYIRAEATIKMKRNGRY